MDEYIVIRLNSNDYLDLEINSFLEECKRRGIYVSEYDLSIIQRCSNLLGDTIVNKISKAIVTENMYGDGKILVLYGNPVMEPCGINESSVSACKSRGRYFLNVGEFTFRKLCSIGERLSLCI